MKPILKVPKEVPEKSLKSRHQEGRVVWSTEMITSLRQHALAVIALASVTACRR